MGNLSFADALDLRAREAAKKNPLGFEPRIVNAVMLDTVRYVACAVEAYEKEKMIGARRGVEVYIAMAIRNLLEVSGDLNLDLGRTLEELKDEER
jgi:hypothetical protein